MFKIGDHIESNIGTQEYIIVDIDEVNKIYICVDALCGRKGKRGIFSKTSHNFIGWAHEKDFNICKRNRLPIVDDKYVDEYNLPQEWKYK